MTLKSTIGPYIVSKCHERWSTNSLKLLDRGFTHTP